MAVTDMEDLPQVVAIPPAGLPKTPSGKIQRYALRQGDGSPAGGIATT
jgi:acyl-coenzyme A synthetase/AMP-(fatty) acid ligase